MKTKISAFLLVCSLFLTVTPFSFAQSSLNDWSAVREIVAGTDLIIKTSNGKTVKGSLLTVNDIEIALSSKGNRFGLSKNNIEAVYFVVPKSGKRAKLIGAAVGLVVVPLAVGAAGGDEISDNYSALIILPIAGFAGGAFIGSLFGKGKKKGGLIYQAK